MENKISVILPVYNAERYLNKSVDSILMQTERQLELILVDDGSNDKSGLICDSYAEQDRRVKVIHQKNSGVSAARNAGIKMATGEYIGFVDSDDWIDDDMFKCLYKQAKNNDADIVMCDAVTEYKNGKKRLDTITQLKDEKILNKKDFSPELLMEMAGSVWRCIYRTILIKKYNLYFNTMLKFSEDRVFNIYAMGYANKVVYKKKPYYHYLIQSDSAVHSFHKDYYEAIKKAAYAMEAALTYAWERKIEYLQIYKHQLINGAIAAINNYYHKDSTFSIREKREMLKKICNDRDLVKTIEETGYGGVRAKWIVDGNIVLLGSCAWYVNIKCENRRLTLENFRTRG